MAGRFTVLPDERFVALQPELLTRLRATANALSGEGFADLCDAPMRTLLLDGFARANADEGTVWMLDEPREALIPRLNSGPHAEQFVGSFRQSLRAGMISMVVATQQPICENEMARNASQDRTLDEQLRVQTCAMLAVPFFFLGELRGVISCVQLKHVDAPQLDHGGFTPEDLDRLQLTTGVLARLIEYRLVARCLGLENLG